MAQYHPSPSFTNSEFNSVLFTLFRRLAKHRSPAPPLFDINPKGSLYTRIEWPAARHFSIFFAFYLCTSDSQPRFSRSKSPPTASKRFPPEKKSLPVIHARSLFLLSFLFLPFLFSTPVRWNLIDPRPISTIDKRTKEPWIRGLVIIRMWCMECGNWINRS